ncbi:MAG: HAMP domain-containing protein, partial [Methanosarcinales archaeon]|nr:HAMP domain-containing protein [Methanosarcinales archaeon]
MNISKNMAASRKLMAGFALVLLLILLEKSIGYLEYVAASSASTAIASFVIAAIIMGVVNALILSRVIARSLNPVMVGANNIRNAGVGYGVLCASGIVTTPGSASAAEEKNEEPPVEQEKENLQEEPEESDRERQSLEDITLIDQLTREEGEAVSNTAPSDGRMDSQQDQLADQKNRIEELNNEIEGGKSEMEECEERLDELTTENEYLKTQIRDFVPLMKSLAEGDLTKRAAKTTDDELGELADAYNNTVENIQALAEDAGVLAEAGIEGKLDVRADASKHSGDFRKIVDGVNDTLDAVIGPLNVAAEYVDRISKGDIPEKITDEYKGDFNEVKNNLNVCIDALNGLVAETGMVGDAAVEGKLDTRGDATKFGGDFGKLVQGINNTLDAVIGPLNVTAEYVDRISKGDIPEKITDEYKGDFNEIKNNINILIDALNGLINEATT